MVNTKLDAMNYAINVLQEKFDSVKDEAMKNKSIAWRYQDFVDCRDALDFIKREAAVLKKASAKRKQNRDEKWQYFFRAIKPYANEWHTAFDLYTLVKDEIGNTVNFSSFYNRLSCWCIASEKKGKQERVYRFMPERYHGEFGEI